MKIQIKGIYRKINGHWVVELPSLAIKVEGTNPFKAFKSLEDLIQREIGLESECSFCIHDDGCFELHTGKSSRLISYIAKKIYEHAHSAEDIGKILSEIKFKGDLEDI